MLVQVCLQTLKGHLCTTIIHANKHNKCNAVQILYQYVFSYCRNSLSFIIPICVLRCSQEYTVDTLLSHMSPLHTLPPKPRFLPFRFSTEYCTPVHANTITCTNTKRGRFKFSQCLGLGLDEQEIRFDWGQGQEFFSRLSHTGSDNLTPTKKETGLFPKGYNSWHVRKTLIFN
jgi:hypothetical protein